MAKIIRLTESELTRIVKKILKEQNDKFETLNPPVQIKIWDDYHGNEPLLWELTDISKGPVGCEFRGKPRGVSGNWKPNQNYGDGFMYNCNDNTFISNMARDERKISDEAKKRIRAACGCDQYARTNNKNNMNIG